MRPEAAADAPLEIHLGDQELELKARAHEVGERRFEERMAEYGRVKHAAVNMVASGFLLLRETAKARHEMVESGNLYYHEAGVSAEDYRLAALADFDRFVGPSDELIDAAAAETKQEIGPDDSMATVLKELVRDYVRGDMDEAALVEAKNRLLQRDTKHSTELIREQNLYTDNLLEVAQLVKAKAAAGETLDGIMDNTKVYLDRVRLGVRTETHFSGVEKLVDKIHSSKLRDVAVVGTLLANETVVAAAVSTAYTLGRWSARRAASAATAFGLIGVSAGAFAALRENSRLKSERSQYERERAQGLEAPTDGASRRAQFEAAHYEARPAVELQRELLGSLFDVDGDGNRQPKTLDHDGYDAALASLVEIEARRAVSARAGVDLIGFSSAVAVAQERRDLFLAAAQAKVMLRESGLNPEFDNELSGLVAGEMRALGGEMEAKDKIFRGFKRRQVTKAFAKGALLGATVGLVAQEVTALMRPDEQGVTEAWTHHNAQAPHATLLRQWLGGHHGAGQTESTAAGASGALTLVPEGKGTYELMQGDHVVQSGLHAGPHGLDAASTEKLTHAGYKIEVQPGKPVSEPESLLAHVSDRRFAELHSHELTSVHRTEWATGANEQRLDWGGVNASGVDAHGDYAFSVASMTADGSGGENVRSLVAGGHLKVLLSASEGTQNRVFEVSVDTHGNAIIEAKSAAGQALFGRDGAGHAVFNGRYAEVAALSPGSGGVENAHVFATYVGPGQHELATTVTHNVSKPTTIIRISHPAEGGSATAAPEQVVLQRTDVPPVLPLGSRRTLEPSERRNEPAATVDMTEALPVAAAVPAGIDKAALAADLRRAAAAAPAMAASSEPVPLATGVDAAQLADDLRAAAQPVPVVPPAPTESGLDVEALKNDLRAAAAVTPSAEAAPVPTPAAPGLDSETLAADLRAASVAATPSPAPAAPEVDRSESLNGEAITTVNDKAATFTETFTPPAGTNFTAEELEAIERQRAEARRTSPAIRELVEAAAAEDLPVGFGSWNGQPLEVLGYDRDGGTNYVVTWNNDYDPGTNSLIEPVQPRATRIPASEVRFGDEREVAAPVQEIEPSAPRGDEQQSAAAWRPVALEMAPALGTRIAQDAVVTAPAQGLAMVVHAPLNDNDTQVRVRLNERTAQRAFGEGRQTGDVAVARVQIGEVARNWADDQLEGVAVGINEVVHEGRLVQAAFTAERHGRAVILREGHVVSREASNSATMPSPHEVTISAHRVLPGDVIVAYPGREIDRNGQPFKAAELESLAAEHSATADLAVALRAVLNRSVVAVRVPELSTKVAATRPNAAQPAITGRVPGRGPAAIAAAPPARRQAIPLPGRSGRGPIALPGQPETEQARRERINRETRRSLSETKLSRSERVDPDTRRIQLSKRMVGATKISEIRSAAEAAVRAGIFTANEIPEGKRPPVWQRYRPVDPENNALWDEMFINEQVITSANILGKHLEVVNEEQVAEPTRGSLATLKAHFTDSEHRSEAKEWTANEVDALIQTNPSTAVAQALRTQLWTFGHINWTPPANYEEGALGRDPYGRGAKFEPVDEVGEAALRWLREKLPTRRHTSRGQRGTKRTPG